MKSSTIFISILVTLLFSCKPSGKLQRTQNGITKTDTTVASNKENKIADSATVVNDSASLVREVYNKVINNKINFNTFTAKVKLAYTDKDGGDEATAFIRLRKDSALWMSLRGPLGIEGFRILVTPDSVRLMNLLNKSVQYRPINFLQQFTGLPLDFSALQDIVVGNPVFIDSNINSFSSQGNFLNILMLGRIFKHLVVIDNTNYKIVESKLNDVNNTGRTCDITYGGFNNDSGVPFSTERKVLLTDESKLNINLNFKQYAFNRPVTFPFNVGENYKRL